MDEALNAGFFVFHTAWIAFNCLGWMSARTRPWHLATISLTALSWFGLGVWFGWGYCPCTDWHWAVRRRMGFSDPPSYIQLLIREVLGLEMRARTAEIIAVLTLVVTAAFSVILLVRDRRLARRARI